MGFTDAGHAWQHFPKELWFGRTKKPVKGYADTLFADQAIDFIKRQQEKPFFLYVAFTAPHLLMEAPAEDVALFKGKFKEKDPRVPLNATYAAMITRLDKEVGRILTQLEQLKLTSKTLIVFSSDHGATFESGNKGTSAFHDSNYPFRGQKRTLWEGGMRVPAVVHWPGVVPAGKVSHEVVHMTDVFPSFEAAASAQRKETASETNEKVDGVKLLEVWKGKTTAPLRTLFWEWRSEGYRQFAAMRGKHKLVITGDNPAELFDVEHDPAERRNILFEHKELANSLKKELQAWLATETEEAKEVSKPVKPK
jgi:arylsulfatase A-like enzyme